MPVFFVPRDAVRAQTLTVRSPLLGHLRDSLRIRVGEVFWVCDAATRHRHHVRVTGIDTTGLTATVLESRSGPPPPLPAVTLAMAVLKGDRMDWAIQKATELGAGRIVPVITERVIVRPKGDRHHQERWQRIALEAAQQSERWDVPVIEPPTAFSAISHGENVGIMLVERRDAAGLGTIALPATGRDIVLLVGPEGGWTERETATAISEGWAAAGLGEFILRAETAAIAGLTLLLNRLGRLG
jgi:16S rRNA (uracil1498-N3)-methyltransferase